MTDDSIANLRGLLGALDPLREDELARVLEIGHARGGAQRIMATRWRRPRPARRGTLSLAAVAVAAGIAALAIAVSLSSSSTPVAYALSFSESGRYLIARILNPYASVEQLSRELAKNHLHVELRLVPASPGSVGKVLELESDGKPANGIQPLFEGHCANGPCTVGLKVARDFKGSGHVYIGRPARRGERYESTPIGGAFAPGEALHCSGLQGATVARVLPALRRRGLEVVRWRVMGGPSKPGADAPAGARVQEVMPIAPGKVELWVGAATPPTLQKRSTRAPGLTPANAPAAAPGVVGSGSSALHSASMSGCQAS